jgi:hypothetical protein
MPHLDGIFCRCQLLRKGICPLARHPRLLLCIRHGCLQARHLGLHLLHLMRLGSLHSWPSSSWGGRELVLQRHTTKASHSVRPCFCSIQTPASLPACLLRRNCLPRLLPAPPAPPPPPPSTPPSHTCVSRWLRSASCHARLWCCTCSRSTSISALARRSAWFSASSRSKRSGPAARNC